MPTLRVEYAKSGRAKCSVKSCNKVIAKHELRIGTQIILPFSDDGAESWKWRHLCCFTDRQISNAKTSGDLDKIDGFTDLAPADRALVEKMKRGELIGTTTIIGRVGDVANSPLASELMGKGTRAPPKKKAAKGDGDSESPSKAAPKPAAKRAPRKPKAAKESVDNDVASDATDEYDVEVRAQSAKPVCPYGKNCFRTGQDHFEQFSHGEEAEDTSRSGGSASVLKPVIVRKRARTESLSP